MFKNNNKINIIIFKLIVFIYIISLSARESSIIHGKILSKDNNRPLVGVNVTLMGTNFGAASDSSGYYSIQYLAAGKYTIKADMIGYEPHIIKDIILGSGEKQEINFTLLQKVLEFSTLIVEADRFSEKYQTEVSLVGVQRMKQGQIVTIPGAFDDPVRAVQIYSGVSGAGDFNSFLAVRGGSPDQNLFVMDGSVIPNPYRFRMIMGGGLSSLNPHTIQDMHLHMGGFSAEYGNCLSSVLEVDTRSGNRQRLKFKGSLNLTDISGVVEGPIIGKRGSFLLAGRRTYFDFLANQITQSNSTYPYCSEFFTKWVFNVNENNLLTLKVMMNNEETSLISELSESINLTESAETNLAIITWEKSLEEKWRFNTILTYYWDNMGYRAYKPDTTEPGQENEEILDAEVTKLTLKENAIFKLNEKNWLTCGIYASFSKPNINFCSNVGSFYWARNEFPKEILFKKEYMYYAAYFEHTSEIMNRLQLRVGIRFDYSNLIGDSELSPRFSFWYKINDHIKIDGSLGIFYQYPDPTSIYTRERPLNLIGRVDVITAEKSTHHVIGIQKNLSTDFSVKCNAYYKDIDRLLLPDNEETYLPYNTGRGISKGIEFILEKKPSNKSRINGLISYSYTNSKYRNIMSNQWIPFNFDSRHGFTVYCNMNINKKWHVNLLGRISSGLPYTDITYVRIVQKRDNENYWYFIKGQLKAARFPLYQRFDLRLSYRIQQSKRYFSFYLDFINLTNYKNVYDMTWEKGGEENNTQTWKVAKKRIIYMLPFLPSLGLSFQL